MTLNELWKILSLIASEIRWQIYLAFKAVRHALREVWLWFWYDVDIVPIFGIILAATLIGALIQRIVLWSNKRKSPSAKFP